MIIFDSKEEKAILEFGDGDIAMIAGLTMLGNGSLYLSDHIGSQEVGSRHDIGKFGITPDNVAEKSDVIFVFKNAEGLRALIESLEDTLKIMVWREINKPYSEVE